MNDSLIYHEARLSKNRADYLEISEIVRNFAGEMELKVFHGTTQESAKSILTEGFTFSLGNEHWLGDGVYFFVEGVGYAPERAAELWAEYRAYKQQSPFCALIEASIHVDEECVLDLTTYEGIRILNYIQRKCAQKLATIGRGVGYVDGYLINFAREEMGLPIDVVKGNEYIQLEESDRRYNIRRRVSNCTICSVYNKNVLSDLTIKKTWRI